MINNIQALLNLLIDIREALKSNTEFNDGGLCYLAECVDESADFTKMMEYAGISWIYWPEYSGHVCFPVPHPTKKASEAYFETDDMYAEDTEYGQARRRLLDWLIEQCEIKLDKLSNV